MAGPLFKKILIANRGEIAVRVIRACRELNIKTVAVYSEVDKSALHVRFADEAYPVGAPESKHSYLAREKILDVARQSGAAAIHPGYGFLAENPTFAQRVLDGGFVFIGPGPHAMQLMGDKTAARKKMQQSGVPVVPGMDAALNNETEAIKIADQFGYPVLLKAAAGGGGKGMRIVKQESEMASAFRAASSEAGSAFGDNRIYIEKYLG